MKTRGVIDRKDRTALMKIQRLLIFYLRRVHLGWVPLLPKLGLMPSAFIPNRGWLIFPGWLLMIISIVVDFFLLANPVILTFSN